MRRGVCKNILYNNAMQLIESGRVKVIDVRDASEIKGKSLPKSINIPVNDLAKRINLVVPNKNDEILVYCSSGSRSIFACQILADLGYSKVYNLYGGFLDENKRY